MKPKTLSRHAILSHICNFSLGKEYLCSKSNQFIENQNPPIGSLVAIASAPTSKWYLSWVVDYKQGRYDKKILLESIDDNTLCWWSNITIYEYPIAVNFPDWRWTDEQHLFNNRWLKVKRKEKEYSFIIPTKVIFENKKVSLGIREKFTDNILYKTFNNWKKIKFRDMIEWFEEGKIQYVQSNL